jgi:hypothetical protein
MLAHFIAHDPQHSQLADRELAGERRWQWTGCGKVPAAGNRDRALRGPLMPPGREDRRPAGWKARRLDLAPEDASPGMQALG